MKILSINIRGFGGVSKIRMLRELLCKESLDFLSVQETRLSDGVERIVNSIWTHDDYAFCHSPSQGRSCGLLCIWKKSFFRASNAFVGDTFLGVGGYCQGSNNLVTFFNIYGPHNDSARKRL